jgi:hypothetical protein
MQLAVSAIWGVVICTLALLLTVMLRRALDLGPGDSWIRLCAASAPVLAMLATGAAVEWHALSLLREGIRLHRWQEDEVDALRRHVERPVWSVISILLFLLIFASLVSGLLLWPPHSIFVGSWVLLFMPANLIARLRRALQKRARSTILDGTTRPFIS